MTAAEVIDKVKRLWEGNFRDCLTDDHGVEVRLLVKAYESYLEAGIGVEDLLFEAEAALQHAWELLNVGKWMEVADERKEVYAIASYIKIVGLLDQNKPDALEKSLEVADLGILLGLPFKNLSLTDIADLLSSKIQQRTSTSSSGVGKRPKEPPEESSTKKPKLENELESVSRPSLEFFRENYFEKNKPVKLRNCMDHWPALENWKDLGYIVKKAGHRTVPVELGKHYADGSYSQKLMKISEFVEEFFREDADRIGYLAQHQLFDQVPELKKDITLPDYCALSQSSEESSCETEINAWFGPKGTVSPLHFDPKHNLLCQVVGTKKIILYPQTDTEFLYPHEGSLLFNTSKVDVENPDDEAFPLFRNARKRECQLSPGEMLYIPPKYWHHVKALENSFSVSFWWE